MFLLAADDQRRLIARFGESLAPGGRLLFTAPARVCAWKDLMTGIESVSLGAVEYRRLLGAAGLSVEREYEDEGRTIITRL